MPSLDELRRLLARGIGNTDPKNIREGVEWDLEGAADHLDDLSSEDLPDLAGRFDAKKMAAERKSGPGAPPRFTRASDGKDAIILFGKHNGKSLKAVYGEDPSYLGWLLREFRGMVDKDSLDFVGIVEYIIRESD